MPIVETLPVTSGVSQWPLWSTTARIVVTDPDRLEAARAVVVAELAAVEQACSRFRSDTELHTVVYPAAGRPVRVSSRLAALVGAALHAASWTEGDVDPTVGARLSELGYDRDFAQLPGPVGVRPAPLGGPNPHRGSAAMSLTIVPTPEWRMVRLDGDLLSVPAGVQLDLGSTAKAWAADRCASLVADQCRVGVLVSLGGDIATAGPSPAHGWRVLVRDRPGDPGAVVRLPAGAALATSSTVSRRWGAGMHHIIDPRLGMPCAPIWRTASVAARDCVTANTVSTATLVRGARAPRWLREIGAPARLVDANRRVRVFGSWRS